MGSPAGGSGSLPLLENFPPRSFGRAKVLGNSCPCSPGSRLATADWRPFGSEAGGCGPHRTV